MSEENLSESLYLDISELEPSRVVFFEKWMLTKNPDSGEEDRKILLNKICMLSQFDDNICHKYRGFNKFTKKTYPIPTKEDGWLNIDDIILEQYDSEEDGTLENFSIEYKNKHMNNVLESICNPKLSIFTDDKQIMFNEIYSNWKCYKTLDNYNTGFLVF